MMKVTIDVDADIYRAIKVEAARSDRSVKDVFDEALDTWLATSEEREDRESATAALAEYERAAGESAESFFRSLAAETRATYGSDKA